MPRNLLSKEAAGKSLEEITAALSQEKGHSMYLTDVSPRADIGLMFSRWEFQVEQSPSSPDRMILRFTSADQFKEAMRAFGGGLRGAFRVDRQRSLGNGHRLPVRAFLYTGFYALLQPS